MVLGIKHISIRRSPLIDRLEVPPVSYFDKFASFNYTVNDLDSPKDKHSFSRSTSYDNSTDSQNSDDNYCCQNKFNQ